MGGDRRGRASARARRIRPLVAFDFDGTLTCARQLPRLPAPGAPGRRGYAAGLARAGARRRSAMCCDRDRGRLKAAAVRGSWPACRAPSWRPRRDASPTAHAPRACCGPTPCAPGDAGRAQGARLVIVTASPEIDRRALRPRPGRRRADRHAPGLRRRRPRHRRARRPELPRAGEGACGCGRRSATDVRLEAAYGDSDGDTRDAGPGRGAGHEGVRRDGHETRRRRGPGPPRAAAGAPARDGRAEGEEPRASST